MTDKPHAFEKRVKRQVTAREHRFFVVVSPGLVPVCIRELDRLFDGNKPLTQEDGGIEFEGNVTDLYRANLHLRTASRIIMRLTTVKASDFATLEHKINAFPWDLYLFGNTPLSVQVTVKKSRLYHSDALAQRIKEWVEQKLVISGQPGPEPVKAQTLFVRGQNDRFTLSLDSSGDLLYMRGLKTGGGKAPIRETLAAGMLTMAGYDGVMPLIDPMCGTGSFSLEAALMALGIPPGWYRDFAFFSWPCFRTGTWQHLRRDAEQGILDPEVIGIYASDLDSKACEQLSDTVTRNGLNTLIRVCQSDVFSLIPDNPEATPGLIMFNPPYGQRMGTQKQSVALIRQMFAFLRQHYSGWRVGLISPFDAPTLSPGFHLDSQTLFHGGMTLFFLWGIIP